MNYTLIDCCRLCQSKNLDCLWELGDHYLSCRFPLLEEEDPLCAPLTVLKCQDCDLIQLSINVDSNTLYLQHYGYRSGLNNTMINHLTNLVREIEDKVIINSNDVVLDIGSNDSTLLQQYKKGVKVGIDPTGNQFKSFYTSDITLLPTFFNKEIFNTVHDKAKVITTISMFYDLPDPLSFAQDIKDILDDNGLWVSEQSYCMTMIKNNAFDTIVHEHLLYLNVKQFYYIANKLGLKIIDISLNDCNGGSFRVTLSHSNSIYPEYPLISEFLAKEEKVVDLFNQFKLSIEENKKELTLIINNLLKNNKTIYLYGASTKGNTLLQYYNINSSIIKGAAERNPEKYGRRTPGTNIKIMSEKEVREQHPDYLLVLPWHFKSEFIKREKEYLDHGGHFIFPLPNIEII